MSHQQVQNATFYHYHLMSKQLDFNYKFKCIVELEWLEKAMASEQHVLNIKKIFSNKVDACFFTSRNQEFTPVEFISHASANTLVSQTEYTMHACYKTVSAASGKKVRIKLNHATNPHVGDAAIHDPVGMQVSRMVKLLAPRRMTQGK